MTVVNRGDYQAPVRLGVALPTKLTRPARDDRM
jgi:hypothetical protein